MHPVGFIQNEYSELIFLRACAEDKESDCRPVKFVISINTLFQFIATLSRGIISHYCTSLWWHFVTVWGWEIFIESNSYLCTNLFSIILTANSSTMTHLTKHWKKTQKISLFVFPFCVKKNEHQVCRVTSGQIWFYFPFSLNLLSAITDQLLWPINI